MKLITGNTSNTLKICERKRHKNWLGIRSNLLYVYILVSANQKSLQKENVAAQLESAVEGAGFEEEEGQGDGFVPLGDIPGQ